MSEPVSLAEWIAELRAELTEAVTWQREREGEAEQRGSSLAVPALALKELKLDLEIKTSRQTGSRGGLKFWVVSGDVDRKESSGTTQRVTLVLTPTGEVHLGDDEGFVPK